MRTSIIIPTYNERENLLPLLERLSSSLADHDYEVVIVDDNSPDGTGELAEELIGRFPLRVIHRQGKLGLASAVVEGMSAASGDSLVVMDADLQHPPEVVPQLVRALKDADVAIASRYVRGGGMKGWALSRRIISRVAKLIPRIPFAQVRGIKDPLSGFFALKREVIEGVKLEPIGFKILLEILVKGKYARVTEVPFTFRRRERGKSTFSLGEQINYLRHVWRLAWSEGEVLRFLKFCLVGGSGVLVNFGFYTLLTRILGLGVHEYDVGGRVISFALSTELGILNNFTWNNLWTFRDRRNSSLLGRLSKFHLVALTGDAPSIAFFWGLIRFAGILDLIAVILAIAAASVIKFVLNTIWTWR